MARKTLHLGKPSRIPASPAAAVLDRVANPHPDTDYVARFTAPEFTTLCPITGQPDFAHLVIDYVPGKWLLESKSLKLHLGSFRNVGSFHEDCTVAIGKKVVALIKPKFLAGCRRTCGCLSKAWPHTAGGDNAKKFFPGECRGKRRTVDRRVQRLTYGPLRGRSVGRRDAKEPTNAGIEETAT